MNITKKNTQNSYFILHFGELILKGKNRKDFEKALIENLRYKLQESLIDFKKEYGKLILYGDKEKIIKALNTTPGIKNRSECQIISFSKPLLTQDLIQQILQIIENKINLNQIKTFKIETKRSNKNFQPNSVEINKTIASFLIQKYPHLKVDLKNPEKTIYLEIGNSHIYLYFEKNPGLGGLPVGTSGIGISLLSGGIDSPVASFLMIKRGMKLIFVHAYNKSADTEGKIKKKIINLTKKLAEYNMETILYLVPMCEIIQQIIEKVPPKRRMLIFKRSIIKIANKIAKQEKAGAIITGDNLAQVASQTLENINAIYKVSDLPILPPLIGFDKEDIIKLAKQIGTYDISIIPAQDLCSKIAHKHPITKASLEKANKIDNIHIPNLDDLPIEKIQIAP